MSPMSDTRPGIPHLFMGNEAIVRGALEAGVDVAAGYPGTPSSEIIENLARFAAGRNLYVEWSVNETVALEVAAAASFAGLRALCPMKQNGVNVASDFLLHLALSGTRGGLVLIHCDDPGALSSVNEGESRHFAKMIELPLLEPGDFQEAKDMMRWAFTLSEELRSVIMFRSVTRLSHASGNVTIGNLPDLKKKAFFRYSGSLNDPLCGPVITTPVSLHHAGLQKKLKRAAEIFENSPFNTYTGPEKPELLIITSSICALYSMEAVSLLGLEKKVGILKVGTTWPLPPALIRRHLEMTDAILFVEEVLPFLEENVKVIAAETAHETGVKTFYGKNSLTIPMNGELNPDLVVKALKDIFSVSYTAMPDEYREKAGMLASAMAPGREFAFCPGCPHRASYFSIHNALEMDGRQGFVCGDIGCYTFGFLACGFSTLKTSHSMGSGIGLASGFGKLGAFGMAQPVLAVCGDSTFYHAAVPALINAVHHRSDTLLIILDNSGTAMTGFQPHPGIPVSATGESLPAVDIPAICRAIGARVEFVDPFDLDAARGVILELLEDSGTRVLMMRQPCALSPERRGVKKYEMAVNETKCLGDQCGCGRFCTKVFRCPGLVWNKETGAARIDEVICAGCGVCAGVCPSGAITKREAARA